MRKFAIEEAYGTLEDTLEEAHLEKACFEEDGFKDGCLKKAASRGRGAGGWCGGGDFYFAQTLFDSIIFCWTP